MKINGNNMKKNIYSLRYGILPCFILALSACDILTPKSPAHESCKGIALDRLKHPESFRELTETETAPRKEQREVNLTFNAWNDYKVPMPFSITCLFQKGSDGHITDLLTIRWNGRPLRRHELDDIRQSLKN